MKTSSNNTPADVQTQEIPNLEDHVNEIQPRIKYLRTMLIKHESKRLYEWFGLRTLFVLATVYTLIAILIVFLSLVWLASDQKPSPDAINETIPSVIIVSFLALLISILFVSIWYRHKKNKTNFH